MISERLLFLATVFLAYPGAYSVGCSLYLEVSHLALSHRRVCKAITLTLVACSIQKHFKEPFCVLWICNDILFTWLVSLWLFNNSASDLCQSDFCYLVLFAKQWCQHWCHKQPVFDMRTIRQASRKAEGFKPCPNGLILQIGHIAAERCFLSCTEIPSLPEALVIQVQLAPIQPGTEYHLSRIGSCYRSCGCRSCDKVQQQGFKETWTLLVGWVVDWYYCIWLANQAPSILRL